MLDYNLSFSNVTSSALHIRFTFKHMIDSVKKQVGWWAWTGQHLRAAVCSQSFASAWPKTPVSPWCYRTLHQHQSATGCRGGGGFERHSLSLSSLTLSCRGWRKGSMAWMVLLSLLTTLIIIFQPATRQPMNSQYQTNRQEMKEQMLSSMPGVSFIYREPVPTTWDGLCSLLRIIETFFFSIWRLMDSLFGLTKFVHSDEVTCLILWL